MRWTEIYIGFVWLSAIYMKMKCNNIIVIDEAQWINFIQKDEDCSLL